MNENGLYHNFPQPLCLLFRPTHTITFHVTPKASEKKVNIAQKVDETKAIIWFIIDKETGRVIDHNFHNTDLRIRGRQFHFFMLAAIASNIKRKYEVQWVTGVTQMEEKYFSYQDTRFELPTYVSDKQLREPGIQGFSFCCISSYMCIPSHFT